MAAPWRRSLLSAPAQPGDGGSPERAPPSPATSARRRILPSRIQLRALARRASASRRSSSSTSRGLAGVALPRARPARALLRRAADPLGAALERRGEVAAVPRARDRARLLARRPVRAARAARGRGRIVSSLLLVTRDHARVRGRHGLPALDLRPLRDGVRAQRDRDRAPALELRGRDRATSGASPACAGARCSSARASGSTRLRRALGLGRGGIDYEFLGALSSDGEPRGLPVLGGVADLPRVLREQRPTS